LVPRSAATSRATRWTGSTGRNQAYREIGLIHCDELTSAVCLVLKLTNNILFAVSPATCEARSRADGECDQRRQQPQRWDAGARLPRGAGPIVRLRRGNQSVFGRLAGSEDVNDTNRLCSDPAMRWVVGGRAIQRFAALTSQMGRFETKWLSRPEKPAALADLPTPRGSTMCTKRRKARYPRL